LIDSLIEWMIWIGRRRRDIIGEDEDDGSDYTVDDVHIADVEQSGEVDKQYVTLYVEKNSKLYLLIAL